MSLPASAELAEAVADAMQSLGALAVTTTPVDGHDILEPLPGKQPLAAMNIVTGLYEATDEPARLRTGLLRALQEHLQAEPSFETLADADWEQAWRQRAVAREFGDGLWVLPADAELPAYIACGCASGSRAGVWYWRAPDHCVVPGVACEP